METIVHATLEAIDHATTYCFIISNYTFDSFGPFVLLTTILRRYFLLLHLSPFFFVSCHLFFLSCIYPPNAMPMLVANWVPRESIEKKQRVKNRETKARKPRMPLG